MQQYEGGEQSAPSRKSKNSRKSQLEKPVETEKIVSSGELEKEPIVVDDNSSDTGLSVEHNQPVSFEKPVDEVEKKPIFHSSQIPNRNVAHALQTVEIQPNFTRESSCTSAPDFKFCERVTFSIVNFDRTKYRKSRRKQSLKLGRMPYASTDKTRLTLRTNFVHSSTGLKNLGEKLCWQMWADSGGFTMLKSRLSTSMGINSS